MSELVDLEPELSNLCRKLRIKKVKHTKRLAFTADGKYDIEIKEEPMTPVEQILVKELHH